MSIHKDIPPIVTVAIGTEIRRLIANRDIDCIAIHRPFDPHADGCAGIVQPVSRARESRVEFRLPCPVVLEYTYPQLTVAVPRHARVGVVAKCCLKVVWPGRRDTLELTTIVMFHELNSSNGEFTVKEIGRKNN